MMNKPVIRVENISKRYRIGVREQAETISEQIKNIVTAPLRNLKNIKRLNTFVEGENEDSIFWALQGINFEVHQGEVLGIIGHNGAGKSTLLKILSKITEPTSGRIEITGRVSSLLEVGTGFHPELTGRDNVFMNGTILGMTKKEIDQKFDEIVTFAGVEKYIDTPIKFYSSGMKVRLGFSVAAHLEPEILIVDEVLAVGDLGFQQKCLGKMDEVSKSGRTVLFVSHNMASIEGLCNRCLLIDQGSIQFQGSTKSSIEQYRNLTLEKAEAQLLVDRKDRRGTGMLRYTQIELNDGNRIFSAKPLKLSLSCYSEFDLSGVQIAITICRNFEERLLVIDTRSQGVKVDFQSGSNNLSITLPKLYLLPGYYVVNIWAGFGTDVLDYVPNATTLKIEETDVYGTGNMLTNEKHGFFFPDLCEWVVSPST